MATMIIPSKAYGARAKRSVAGPSLMARFFSAMKASRQAEAERIVAHYAAGRWSDAAEREINEKLISREGMRLF